jgi:hypothetical protein
MLYPLSYGRSASLPQGSFHSFERDPNDSETFLGYIFALGSLPS